MPGTYVFKPIEANLTHDTNLLTRMNPFCSFSVGDNKVTSQVCSKGGKHPIWNEAVTLTVDDTKDSKLTVELIDKGTLSQDRIGSLTLDLKEIDRHVHSSKWYPLSFNGEPAGELLLEAFIENATLPVASSTAEATLSTTSEILSAQSGSNIFVEQRQVVEPHTFTREIERVETVPVKKQIEVLEPHKIVKEVEHTEYVPVTKKVEVMEPTVVQKEVEVMEPQLVTKTIQVVENVPVKKIVEEVEMHPVIKEIETMEPRVFKEQVEITEQVPVMKEVTVTQPVTMKETVEYVEPVVTTKTITKELMQPVVIDQKIETHVGPATIVENFVVGEKKLSAEDKLIGKVVETEVKETKIYTDDVIQADMKETKIYPGEAIEGEIKSVELQTKGEFEKEVKELRKDEALDL